MDLNSSGSVAKTNKLTNAGSKGSEDISWSTGDLQKLFDRTLEAIPPNDRLSYKTRIDKLNWSKVIFDEHSEAECKKIFVTVVKHVRKYRKLDEVIADMRLWAVGKKNPSTKLKRPLNGFMLYLKDNSSLRKKYPNLSLGEFTKMLHTMYKDLSVDERQRYMDLAKLHSEDYERKKVIYMTNNPSDKKMKMKKKTRDKTAFGEFLEHHIDDNLINDHSDEAMIEIANKWDCLSEDEQLIWFEKAAVKNKEFKDRVQLSEPKKVANPKKQVKRVASSDVDKVDGKTKKKKTNEDTPVDDLGVEKVNGNIKKKAKSKEVENMDEIESENAGNKIVADEKQPKKKKNNDVEVEVLSTESPKKKSKKKKTTPNVDEIKIEVEPISAESPKKKTKKKKIADEANDDNNVEHSMIEEESPKKKKKKKKDTSSQEDDDLNLSASIDEEKKKKRKKKKESQTKEDEIAELKTDAVEDPSKAKKKKRKDRDVDGDQSQIELESPKKNKKKKKKHQIDE